MKDLKGRPYFVGPALRFLCNAAKTKAMKRISALAAPLIALFSLSGCLVGTAVGVAGDVVEGAVNVTGDVAEGAVNAAGAIIPDGDDKDDKEGDDTET